jgi:hypothetical protein
MDFRSQTSMEPISSAATLGWIVLHAGALVAAWGTRVAAGPRIELAVQICFLAAMAAIGGTAWICHQSQLGLWIPSAVTLVAMVLTAVADCRGTHESASLSSVSADR